MIEDEILYVDDAEKAIKEYIQKHWGLLLPFEVGKGYQFQVRINEEQFQKIEPTIKDEMRFWAEHPNTKNILESESEKRWLKENYWTPCKAFIFNYTSKNSFVLRARCKYGYEGLEESYDIVFFEKTDFPPIIYRNFDTSERRNDFNPNFPIKNKVKKA